MQGDSLVGIDQISDEAAAFGVRVNAVAPGPVETAMLDRFTGSADRKSGLLAGITLRRASKPEEVADTILFVASDKPHSSRARTSTSTAARLRVEGKTARVTGGSCGNGAAEVGDRGSTVNNVQPGPINTDLNPAAGDWATPQKAATALNRYGFSLRPIFGVWRLI